MLQQLGLHPHRVRCRQVRLVDRNHDRHFSCLRVINRLYGLRHHTIIRRHYDNRNVRYLCTARAHRGKCLMARGVNESQRAPIVLNLICTDALSDAASLRLNDRSPTDCIQQRRLTVVYVSHDCYHRGTWPHLRLFALRVEPGRCIAGLNIPRLPHHYAQTSCHIRSRREVHDVVHAEHHVAPHQLLDDLSRRAARDVREF